MGGRSGSFKLGREADFVDSGAARATAQHNGAIWNFLWTDVANDDVAHGERGAEYNKNPRVARSLSRWARGNSALDPLRRDQVLGRKNGSAGGNKRDSALAEADDALEETAKQVSPLESKRT